MFGFIGAGIAAISGTLSSVGGAITTACSTIGGAVLSTGRVVLDAINRGLPVVEKICDVAFTVGKAIGIFLPEQNEGDMYELGMRAERSVEEGVHSEQFDSNQEYIDHLRQKIDLSQESIEKLDNLSGEEKLKYACLGSAITIAAIKEKYNVNIPETFWLTSIDVGIEPEQVKPVLDVFEAQRLNPDLDGFLKGELSSDLQRQIYDLIDDRLGELFSNESLDKLLG